MSLSLQKVILDPNPTFLNTVFLHFINMPAKLGCYWLVIVQTISLNGLIYIFCLQKSV